MANNLLISYDLISPSQDYDAVIDRIKTLGSWAKIHKSYWYVKSDYTASEACKEIWAVMDNNDKIFVCDATNGDSAWKNLSDKISSFIVDKWND